MWLKHQSVGIRYLTLKLLQKIYKKSLIKKSKVIHLCINVDMSESQWTSQIKLK